MQEESSSLNEKDEARFWRNVNRDVGPNDCWLWTGGLSRRKSPQYGAFNFPRAGRSWGTMGAHRAAWEFANKKKIPAELHVRHKCDVAICCNPSHLELGTPADNIRDMVSRDRQSRGEGRTFAKLTEKQVLEIRDLLAKGYTQTTIAGMFNITQALVSLIKLKKAWKHI